MAKKKQVKKKAPAQGLVDELNRKKRLVTGIAARLYSSKKKQKGK